MKTVLPINFAGQRYFGEPFPHFQVEEAVPKDAQNTILDWLETDALWSLTRTDFYEQHEFSLLSRELPEQVQFLTSPGFVCHCKQQFERTLSVEFEDRFDVTAHRLTSGQIIKIHNDYLPGQETHRLLIQLNRTWSEDQGGLLILFSQPRADAVAKLVLPKSGSAFGFEISPRSLHAVSTIRSGSRFTLVYSFYARA